jgi:hypothetical protein
MGEFTTALHKSNKLIQDREAGNAKKIDVEHEAAKTALMLRYRTQLPLINEVALTNAKPMSDVSGVYVEIITSGRTFQLRELTGGWSVALQNGEVQRYKGQPMDVENNIIKYIDSCG